MTLLSHIPPSTLSASTLAAHDSLLVLFHKLTSLTSLTSSVSALAPSMEAIKRHAAVDPIKEVTLIASDASPGGRVILCPIGSLYGDVDDVRRLASASRSAVRKALSVGSSKPLLYLPERASLAAHEDYKRCLEVSVLAALQETYVPLQAREWANAKGAQANPVQIGVIADDGELVKKLEAVNEGLSLARDLTGGDPERLTPLRCADLIVEEFKEVPNVTVTVITDVPKIEKEYPLLHAVARCSLVVPRHRPCVVKLEYKAPDQTKVKNNLFFVGKGVTFDTGGADVKAGGAMRGMARDKGGASACAGFLKTVGLFTPTHVNVSATLGFVRNSIGAEGYTCDEILVSRAGKRVLVGNTDAEGRLVMTDLLAEFRERAATLSDPSSARLFTVATLTGHVIRAYGDYPAAVENGPARVMRVGEKLAEVGTEWGGPFEVSRLRVDDFDFIAPTQPTEDVVQANHLPSSGTSRGHQFPAAFMIVASGLDKHGRDAEVPLAYTHLDVAGAVEEHASGLSLGKPTGAPVTALAAYAGLLD
ncbi:peptidase M17, leucyl aminopeptidase domain-containing protein [Gonapodya prolifera JEL478]|uniref:Peptidase M17, leucyl aminopeptidase domain-containing protein n=1 Tax=Gonapodya prolifera (strain JEL478) TaxID=1344416 RepID=A0A139ARU0_GONPJ|nr:peptidase M17, leucyl aminopeptidase domain-containing protein [Gonapodya prolifera JEL478]|eukprot:KXS19457.1 peptidase M17, leucyl aminopeptidase domain-containing protein [Gonapodya prolifera JEL478]